MQTASGVLMIRPAAFGFNPQTAASNRLQRATAPDGSGVGGAANDRARSEFDTMVRLLRGEGVVVVVMEDTPEPARPDAIFPNNWFSLHADGTLCLYPMAAANRRIERRVDALQAALRTAGCYVDTVRDFTGHEQSGRFLEGTGSLVLDHVARVAYACRSPRTDAGLVQEWCDALGYQPEVFFATDASGCNYYHTNVMLSIGTRFAVVASESIAASDRERVLDRLHASGRNVIEIDRPAVANFAANILELASWDEALGDCSLCVLSARARAAFGAEQWRQLSSSVDGALVVPVPTIETLGGGGVRCMMAELFSLPGSRA